MHVCAGPKPRLDRKAATGGASEVKKQFLVEMAVHTLALICMDAASQLVVATHIYKKNTVYYTS